VSFSDEAVPAEEVTPEPELVTDETSPQGGAAEVEVELDPTVVLKSERDEYLLALQRTQADFENYRKRIQRMQEEQSARAARHWSPSCSPCSTRSTWPRHTRPEASAGSDDAKALTAARSMLLDVLLKEGLERVEESAVPFDPAVHDAVARTDAEGGDVVIDECSGRVTAGGARCSVPPWSACGGELNHGRPA